MVQIKNVTFSYSQTSEVLDGVTFDIANGECMGILGNNGTGKSTLLKCIDRIQRTHGMVVLVDGENVVQMSNNQLAQTIAYVPQRNDELQMTVFDAVLLGRKPYIKWDATSRDYEVVKRILCEMGLEELMLRKVSCLSGGEKQKVMIARALAQEPRLLLLDEPTSNLDPYNQQEVLGMIKKIAVERQICVAIVLHDINLAIRYCDRFLFLKRGKVYSCGGIETVTGQVINEVYGMKVEIIDHQERKIVVPA